MKLGSACLQCRTGKRKCSKAVPGGACDQCIKRNLRCSTDAGHPPLTATNQKLYPSGTPDTEDSGNLPPLDVRVELVDLYISYIHGKPHSLFHEPSLRRAVLDGSISHAVLFGILGLSARYASFILFEATELAVALGSKPVLWEQWLTM